MDVVSYKFPHPAIHRRAGALVVAELSATRCLHDAACAFTVLQGARATAEPDPWPC